jgi:GAF domain
VTTVSAIMSSILADDADQRASLPERLCAAAASGIEVTGVGMALMTQDGHEGAVGATDGTARRMEELQFTLGEGPCLDASKQGQPVLVPDLVRTAASRWPGFGPAVLETGVEAIFALPLQVGHIRLGVLDLYRDRPGNLDDGELESALTYADAAVVVLLHLQSQMDPGEGLHPQLADGVGGRPEVHQATGMISVQAEVGLTEALLLLRARAFADERPILEVARDVVARRLRFDVIRRDNEG